MRMAESRTNRTQLSLTAVLRKHIQSCCICCSFVVRCKRLYCKFIVMTRMWIRVRSWRKGNREANRDNKKVMDTRDLLSPDITALAPIWHRVLPLQVKEIPFSLAYAGSVVSHWMLSNWRSKLLVNPNIERRKSANAFIFWFQSSSNSPSLRSNQSVDCVINTLLVLSLSNCSALRRVCAVITQGVTNA